MFVFLMNWQNMPSFTTFLIKTVVTTLTFECILSQTLINWWFIFRKLYNQMVVFFNMLWILVTFIFKYAKVGGNICREYLGFEYISLVYALTLYHMGGGVRTDPPLALSAAILWRMHHPIPNFLTFPNLIPTFIW